MYPAVECPWILWTFSMESLENVRIDNWNDVHGRSPQSPWKGPTVSVEKFHGICPLFSWKMSIVSMENVHRVHGNCPQYPWTFSMDTVDNFHALSDLSLLWLHMPLYWFVTKQLNMKFQDASFNHSSLYTKLSDYEQSN